VLAVDALDFRMPLLDAQLLHTGIIQEERADSEANP
jgi:hypothetical protein